jgi:hypothetical protein
MSVELLKPLQRHFSYASYQNGFCRDAELDPSSPNVLVFETGFYGLQVNVGDLTQLMFAEFDDGLSYQQCLGRRDRMNSLQSLPFSIQVLDSYDQSFVCKTCLAGQSQESKPFQGNVILWEAGRISQRFEIQGLEFDKKGIAGRWNLIIQVWPDSFALTVLGKELHPMESVDIRIQLGNRWSKAQCINPDSMTYAASVTLACRVRALPLPSSIRLSVTTDGIKLPTAFSFDRNAYETIAEYGNKAPGRIKRSFATGYTDIRHYDDYDITISSSDTPDSLVPYVLSMNEPANITGMVPILLDQNGLPTAVPVQISKNWHLQQTGPYAKLYVVLPAAAKRLTLRIAYGFYGSLPSASHAQLSLWGVGGNASGRWDQLAIGCWGETFCIDSELCCHGVKGSITDVRGLFFGPENHYQWTHCAWGGDWLHVSKEDRRLLMRNLKVAYLSHGPCLTNVQYHGQYGPQAEVLVHVQVRTLRTDDYCRTFMTMQYMVQNSVSLGYLHQMLNRAFCTPTVAYGNAQGLIQELSVPDQLEANQVWLKNQVFEASSPFWIAFPDSFQLPDKNPDKKEMPDGFKSLIIQSFEANVGDQCFRNPCFSLVNEIAHWAVQGDRPSLMVNIGLPVTELGAGDSITMEVEWTTHTREDKDYYGPNERYRSFLKGKPRSWKIPFREVEKNGSMFDVTVTEGGELQHKYPIRVQVDNAAEIVTLKVKEGVGAVPMEFCGLMNDRYRLYQVVNDTEILLDQTGTADNDYWQTDFDFAMQTFTITFNPMLGDENETTWRLKSL